VKVTLPLASIFTLPGVGVCAAPNNIVYLLLVADGPCEAINCAVALVSDVATYCSVNC